MPEPPDLTGRVMEVLTTPTIGRLLGYSRIWAYFRAQAGDFGLPVHNPYCNFGLISHCWVESCEENNRLTSSKVMSIYAILCR